MKIAIVEDEGHCARRLIELLHLSGIEDNIEVYNTAFDAINGINQNRPQVVFLDVHLGGTSGFEVLSGLTYRDFNLIFTTAFESYAIKAFKFAAIAYLLKPIEQTEFDEAWDRTLKNYNQTQVTKRIQILLENNSATGLKKRISIPLADEFLFLKIDEIIRCQADLNYTHIYTLNGKKYTSSKTLKHYENLLTPYNFFRIHNAHLLNLEFVNNYNRNGFVILRDGTKLEVAGRRKEEFLKECYKL